MAGRTERNKDLLKDRHQVILAEMLREDANRLCADCHAKGPRWASWNLGVFLCIRCAGIHRNLGVHISKVKSVNLDSWTPNQIDNIVEWGNQRGQDVYECYLPENFCRPQGDSAMETFIRSKYERKLYIAKGDVSNIGKGASRTTKEPKAPEEQHKTAVKPTKTERPSSNARATSATSNNTTGSTSKSSLFAAAPARAPAPVQPVACKSATPVVDDLLSMDDCGGRASPSQASAASKQLSNVDLFTMDGDASGLGLPSQAPLSTNQQPDLFGGVDLFPAATPEQSLFPEHAAKPAQSTKDSIMSLYSKSQQQQQQQQQPPSSVYGVPGGVYMSNAGGFSGAHMQMPHQTHNSQHHQQQHMNPVMRNQQGGQHYQVGRQVPQQMQPQHMNAGPYRGGFGPQYNGGMPQQQQHQSMAAHAHTQAHAMGQGVFNATWHGQPNQQQPILVNAGHSSGAGRPMQPSLPGNSMGHTLSNQLWN